MTNWAKIASKAEINTRIGSLDQDMWMASPANATVNTETRTVKFLGIPVTVAAKTSWKTESSEEGVTATHVATAIGIMAALGAVLAAIIALAKGMV